MSEFDRQNRSEDMLDEEYGEAEDIDTPVRAPFAEESTEAAKNKYDTRKNHIVSLVWVVVLAALLTGLGLWESSRHEEFDAYLHAAIRGADGMVRCYAVGREGQTEEIESFDGSTVEIWEGAADMYETVYEGGTKRLRLARPALYQEGEPVEEISAEMMAVLLSAEEAQTSVRSVYLYREGENWFLAVEPREKLWRPSVFYYYHEDSGELIALFEFDEGEVIGFGLSDTFRREMGLEE